jgi:hypothetical protein
MSEAIDLLEREEYPVCLQQFEYRHRHLFPFYKSL